MIHLILSAAQALQSRSVKALRGLRERRFSLSVLASMSIATATLSALLLWSPGARSTAVLAPSPTQAPLVLARYAQSVVKIEATILQGGRSVATLGRTREGSGVLIDP
ncbi:MAG: hypothetical protein EBQ78_01175, partial [Betaproteobacteria bacterium]|nr:hypothetical protein [Betaproteobacteria bacterium]